MGVEEIDLSIYSSEGELVDATIDSALNLITQKLDSQKECHIALTGGTLGNWISKNLASELNKGDWQGLNIWWSDERFVPYESEERNDLIFFNTIQKSSGVLVHRVQYGDKVSESAEKYRELISKINFDLIILGMGPDGHVASLFPGQLNEDEKRDAFEVINSPKPPKERVTFSLSKINKAKEVWLVASGDAKAGAITELIEGGMKLPVCKVNLSRVLLDSAAFADDSEK